jgi:two-component system cell cycle sensor histidine kinase/response regulator CckA
MSTDPPSGPGSGADLSDLNADELRDRLRSERRVAELARTFLALGPDELESRLQDAVAAAGAAAGADRAQLSWVRARHDGSPGIERYVWAAEGIEPIRTDDDLSKRPRFPWLRAKLLAGEIVHVPRIEDLPAEASAERDSLLEHGNRSYLAVPLLLRGRFLGSVDVRCVRTTRTWSHQEIEGLRLMGDVLASVLQRKEAADGRRESEDRFRTMAENLEVTLCESNADGQVLYASARMPELLGYSAEEALELNLAELLLAEEREGSQPTDSRAEKESAESGRIFRARHKNGSWRSVEALERSYLSRSGEKRLVTLLRDVTEQQARNADLELRLELETLISGLSRRFLSADAGEVDDAIQLGLQSIAGVARADRAFCLSFAEMRRDRSAFYEWCSEAVAPLGRTPGSHDAQQYRGFASRLLAGEIINIPVVAEMPDEFAIERAAMVEAGIRSYLLVPAVSRGRLAGILCLHCVTEERHWSEHEVTLLTLVADLFTSALRRKRNETALGESEERFRALAENSHDPICELSAAGCILYASPAYARLVGCRRSDLEGRNLFDLAHADDRSALGQLVETGLRGSVDHAVVFRTQHQDGSWLDVEVTARGFSTAMGESRLVAVLRDVSVREEDRRALEWQVSGEQQIAELSRFFLDLEPGSTRDATGEKLAVAGSLAGAERSWMFTVDPRGVETFRHYDWTAEGVETPGPEPPADVSAYSWALSKLRLGEELDIPVVADLPEEAAAERTDLLRRGVRSFLGIPLRSGRHFIGHMGFEVATREHHWSSETITLLRLVGQIFASALRREQADIELERSQTQLLQSQKMEAVGTLAGGIAHDFNNHLAVMLGNARFMASAAQGGEDEEFRDALADLQGSAEHCAKLTRSLLAFSRRSPVTIQLVEIGAVMGAVSDLVRPLLPSSIDFGVEATDPRDTVRADPTQLRQVLINLLVNARDAMPEGGHLQLAARRRTISSHEAWPMGLPEPGAYTEITVSDDGEGMAEETRLRIFEPFFTTKGLGEGTGLGLATAYGIVQQSRGVIHVESELGVGTTFRVILPLAEAASRPVELPATIDSLPGSETILLVEDEPAVRRLVSRTLRRRGYRVFEAEDGQAGLELAEAEGDEIDLLVTDLVMPRLGGADLAEKLQAQRPELPVLFVSGHAEPGDASPDARVEGARFLQKPFDEDGLLQEVRFLLDSGSRRDSE